MKISSGLTKAINEQIAMEANASNNYLAMACWCEINGYDESPKNDGRSNRRINRRSYKI